MHYRMFVLLNKKEANSSEEARRVVQSTLIDDPSFVGEGGRFGSPIADWFVIGGRWSGELTKLMLDQKKVKAFYEEFDKKHGWWTPSKETDKSRRTQALRMFKKYFPNFKGEMPYWRDNYKDGGYEDDAQLLDKKLYKAAVKQYEGKGEWGCVKDDGQVEIIDLDDEEINKDLIDKRWLVVVDYHSQFCLYDCSFTGAVLRTELGDVAQKGEQV